MKMNVIPKVNGKIEKGTGTFVWKADTELKAPYSEVNDVFLKRIRNAGLEAGKCAGSAGSRALITYKEDRSLPEEGYRLSILPEEIEICAAGKSGYSNALVTFCQMLVFGNGTVDCMEITDAPRFQGRSVMLDVCRHFFDAEEVKKIIEQCALLKINRFHWHLSDDQGYRVESRRFPELNQISSWRRLAKKDPLVVRKMAEAGEKYGGYYTQDEIREIVAFAAARNVDIIPEIDLPGHSSAILAAFPEFTCSGEPLEVKNTFGVHERIFCAGNEEAYHFLYQLLDELTELFPSEYFHIGGDEAPKKVWHSCPKCRKRYQKEGFHNFEQLQSYFTGKMISYLKAKGKKPIVWNESAISGNLDPEATIQYWAEMGTSESYVVPEIEKGRKFVLSNTNVFYCDSNYAQKTLRGILMYEPEIGGKKVPDESVVSLEAPMWTEWTATCDEIEKSLYPHIAALAECGWSREKDITEFTARLKGFLQKGSFNVMTPESWENATVSGEAALRQIAVSLLKMGARYREMAEAEGEGAGIVGAVEPDLEDDRKENTEASPVLPAVSAAKTETEAAASEEKKEQKGSSSASMLEAFVTEAMERSYSKEEIARTLSIMENIMQGSGR